MFSSEGIEIVHTPYQTPRANAFAERRVRSVRQTDLYPTLILNEDHLRRVLKEYGEYSNDACSHQRMGQRFPVFGSTQNGAQKVQSITEISWEASSTIPTGSLPLRFLAMDKVFTPYTVSLEEFAARNLACKKTRS